MEDKEVKEEEVKQKLMFMLKLIKMKFGLTGNRLEESE